MKCQASQYHIKAHRPSQCKTAAQLSLVAFFGLLITILITCHGHSFKSGRNEGNTAFITSKTQPKKAHALMLILKCMPTSFAQNRTVIPSASIHT